MTSFARLSSVFADVFLVGKQFPRLLTRGSIISPLNDTCMPIKKLLCVRLSPFSLTQVSQNREHSLRSVLIVIHSGIYI